MGDALGRGPVVVPAGLDDPHGPSGGNTYVRRVCDGLSRLGWAIREHPVSANHFMPGPDYGHTASEKYLNSRKLSIYGGSNEIQRNIIAKAVLGL